MITTFLRGLLVGALCLSLDMAVAQSVTVNCQSVLSQTSTQWIQSQQDPTNAAQIYSDCYKRKLDALYQELNDKGNPPLMGASGEFRDFQRALEEFTDTALLQTGASAAHRAAALLYQQQFRYYFYQFYLPNPDLPKTTPTELAEAKASFQQFVKNLPPKKAHILKRSFNHFLHAGASNMKMPQIAIYRYAAFVIKPTGSAVAIPLPF